MSCLLGLCFITGLYINGGMGYQYVHDNIEYQSNDYHHIIGELSLTAEFGEHWYVEAKHISGVNTPELDGGMNAIMFGARIDLMGNHNEYR